MSEQKTLNDLVVSETELNEELLAEVLAPYARIGDESGAFLPTDKFEELASTAQAAVVLLFRKASHELGFNEEEGASPMDIAEASGMNHNTAKGAVRRLDERNLVANDDGEYTIPPYNYDQASELIRGG